ncbi:MAG TPA: ABC transporter permease, partial [Spirochaetota bacterium]|nr:ABC transporter permease [Spirochaetota bacterium]
FSTLVIRELAPLITSLLIINRSAVAITIQLSEMSLSGEVEALEIMGIDPIQYLGTFKVFSGIIIVPILTLYFSISALISGMLSTFFIYNVLPDRYIFEILNTLKFGDIIVVYFKTLFSGFFIFAIAVYNGLFVTGDRGMIISRTVRTVLVSMFIVTLLNFFITFLFYGS